MKFHRSVPDDFRELVIIAGGVTNPFTRFPGPEKFFYLKVVDNGLEIGRIPCVGRASISHRSK